MSREDCDQVAREARGTRERPPGGQRKAGIAQPAPCRRFVRALYLFQMVTQLYVTLQHLLPFALQDVSPWVLYVFKVWTCYMCIMITAHWVSLICYSSVYKPTKDRPHIDLAVFADNPPERFVGNLSLPRPRHVGNGHVAVDVTEKGGLPWRFCTHCDMDVPPRAHHCRFCDVCILRRDHHCHLVGNCVGHWNQRYFVVMAGYGMVIGYVGTCLTVFYLRHHHLEDHSYWTYFLPVALYKLVTGSISGLQALLIFHAHMLGLFAPISNMYFLSQIGIIAMGKTKHEVTKNTNIKVTSSVQDNFRLVFGDYWLVSFLFPAQLIFKQENDGLVFEGIKMGPESAKDVRQLSD